MMDKDGFPDDIMEAIREMAHCEDDVEELKATVNSAIATSESWGKMVKQYVADGDLYSRDCIYLSLRLHTMVQETDALNSGGDGEKRCRGLAKLASIILERSKDVDE